LLFTIFALGEVRAAKPKPHRIFTCGKRGRGRGVVGIGRHGEASICTSVKLYIIA